MVRGGWRWCRGRWCEEGGGGMRGGGDLRWCEGSGGGVGEWRWEGGVEVARGSRVGVRRDVV